MVIHVDMPAEVVVREEWAVRSDDGEIYQVRGRSMEAAEREAALLRAEEPGAAVAHRYVMETPEGTASTGWRWTLGGAP